MEEAVQWRRGGGVGEALAAESGAAPVLGGRPAAAKWRWCRYDGGGWGSGTGVKDGRRNREGWAPAIEGIRGACVTGVTVTTRATGGAQR